MKTLETGRAERFAKRKTITAQACRKQKLVKREVFLSKELSELLTKEGESLMSGSDSLGSAGNVIILQSAAIVSFLNLKSSLEKDLSRYQVALKTAENEAVMQGVALRAEAFEGV